MKPNCNHIELISPVDCSWNDLTLNFLPDKMRQLQEAICNPIPGADFMIRKAGIEYLKSKYSRIQGEFSGCYVLIDENRPVYTGISREVIRRLFRLFKGNSSLSSFATMIANDKVKIRGTWWEKMKNADYSIAYNNAINWIRTFDVALVPIDNMMELYVFAAYSAQSLNTPMLNHFRSN